MSGSTTGGQRGQADCTYASPGYYSDGEGGVRPCPPNQFSDSERPLQLASLCTPCAGGLATGGFIASRSCTYVAVGMMWDEQAGSVAPCPINTYASIERRTIRAASCTPCSTGTGTGDAPGQSGCEYVLPGFHNSGDNKALPCPVDQFAVANRPMETALACSPCAEHTRTNELTGQTSCDYVEAGYKYTLEAGAVACDVDTYSPSVRFKTDAANCLPCGPKKTTNLSTGATECVGKWRRTLPCRCCLT